MIQPYTLDLVKRPGMGNTQIQQDITGATGAASAVGGTIASFIGTPLLGAAVSGAITAAGAIANVIAGIFSGCGDTCVKTSQFANQVEPLLQQNVAKYLEQPIRTQSMQAAFLQVFDQAWSQLVQLCSNPQYGSAGQRCITDRQRGACTWHGNPGQWVQDATGNWTVQAGPAGCWNWFNGYRDPIANDPAVVPDSVLTAPTSSSGATAASTPGSSVLPLLVVAGIVAWVVLS